MSESVSPPDSQEQIFAAFVREFESADDRSAVLEKYRHRHPKLAVELESFAAMEDRLHAANPPADQPPPRRLEPGQRLGDFTIARLIAAGGMGEVYEAKQGSLDRRVAVKVIRRGRIADQARKRFTREQTMLAKLHQTHIVPIHTAGVEGDIQYFAMAYIDGAPLNRVVDTAYERETARTGKQTPSLRELAESVSSQDQLNGESAADATAPYPIPPTPPRPPKDPTLRLHLSPAYFRSVAEVMAQAAEAVQHAHDAGIYHRDIKPSNLMVDRFGHCWIIDFGLAGLLEHPNSPPPASAHAGEALTQSPMGTPQYMAPEQHRGEPEPRSDVWGLGVTLYELLTLRRAFEGTSREEIAETIERGELRTPVELNLTVPMDLSAICAKAMKTHPDQRYASANELAADLRRWLKSEPTNARPVSDLRRTALWAKRNPGWATALGGSLLAGIAMATLAYVTADARANEASARADAANLQAQAAKREKSLMEFQRRRTTDDHEAGWSDIAWRRACDIAQLGAGTDIRDEAVATLEGWDATRLREFEGSASSVAFDAASRRLLLGGTDTDPDEPAQEARLWDGTVAQLDRSGRAGSGPVGFTADGTPLQIIRKEGHALLIWDVAKHKPLRELVLPADAKGDAIRIVLSSNASLVGACTESADGKGRIFVWETATGKLMATIAQRATALALSPDNQLIASGNGKGEIVVHQLDNGNVLVALPSGRAQITALAFCRDPRHRIKEPPPHCNWVVGAGDRSGTVTLWELATRVPRCVCRGSAHAVYSISFSADGTRVFSAGRYLARLFDATTGRQLLSLPGGNLVTGITISPDGNRVATSSRTSFYSPGMVRVWDLQPDRGIKTLPGLNAQVEKVLFSPDERLMAALDHNGTLGVWELATGRLLHLFEVPFAFSADNAALAFSADGQRLAYVAPQQPRGQLRVWNLTTGQAMLSRDYPFGHNSVLAFHGDARLLLFQEEPGGDTGCVGRIRDLMGDADKPLVEITEFHDIEFPVMPADGRFLGLVGYFGNHGQPTRVVKVVDSFTGAEVWSSNSETVKRMPDRANNLETQIGLLLDRAGKVLSILRSDHRVGRGIAGSAVELPSGKLLGPAPPITGHVNGWSPSMPFWIDATYQALTGQLAFVPRGSKDRVLILGIDNRSSGVQKQFNAAGDQFAWGNADGRVNVANLNDVFRRLNSAKLDGHP